MEKYKYTYNCTEYCYVSVAVTCEVMRTGGTGL